MAHILVAATPAPGHVNPMLAVARHLSSLGHSITFLSGKLFRDQAMALGFQFVPFTGKADFDYRRLKEEFPELVAAAPGPDAMNAICICCGIDPVPDQNRVIQEILTQAQVDLIVTDCYFWGVFPLLLSPRDARPPVLTFGVLPFMVSSCDVAPLSGPDASPEGRIRNQEETKRFFAMMEPSTVRMRAALHACGAPELPEFFLDCAAYLPDRFLQLTAEAFEYPRSDLRENVQFIGNIPPNGESKLPLPQWWSSLDTSQPVVLVTQGTLANWDMSQLIEPTIDALQEEQLTLIVAAGRPDLDVIQLPGGNMPRNVRVENYIPFEQALPKVDVFVTNGGFGAVNLSLAYGVPMVVAGDTEDKTFTANRVGWSKAGINLGTGHPTAELIRKAVHEVLSDKKYKSNALRLQKEFARYRAFDLMTETVNSMLSLTTSHGIEVG